MLVNLHAHHLSHTLFDSHEHWGPFWEDGTMRVGNWTLGNNVPNATHPAERRTLAKRREAMQQRGIDKLVLSPPSHLYLYHAGEWGTEWARRVNDELAAFTGQAPDQLYFWGMVPMGDPDEAPRELERVMDDLGGAGITIGAANMGNGREVYHRAFDPLWEKVVERKVPIFVHGYNQTVAEDTADDPFDTSSIVGMNYDETRFIWYLINGGVLDRFPELRFYVTHGGGFFPYQLGRFSATNKTMAPDSVNRRPVEDYLDNFYFDPDIHEPAMRRALVEVIGADRLLYGDNMGGSDGHIGDLTADIGVSDADREKIRSANALSWIPRLSTPVPARA